MNKFREYICRSKKENAGVGFIGVAAAVTGIQIILRGSDIYIGYFLLLPCFILLWSFFTNSSKVKNFFKELEDKGILEEVLKDFEGSKEYANGNCRLGKKYLYRKKRMSVLPYSDIGEMEITQKAGDNGTEYSLFFKRKDGLFEKLCALEGDNAKEKGERIIKAIESGCGKGALPEEDSDIVDESTGEEAASDTVDSEAEIAAETVDS